MERRPTSRGRGNEATNFLESGGKAKEEGFDEKGMKDLGGGELKNI